MNLKTLSDKTLHFLAGAAVARAGVRATSWSAGRAGVRSRT